MTLDMTQVTCANYLAMSSDQAHVFSAWISGWFNQKFGYITVGFDDFSRNVVSIRQWLHRQPAGDNYGGLRAFHPATRTPDRPD
ncbi:MAG: hypothetical protein WA728_34335 [Xanthobacteraceae bacterium]